MRIVRGLGRVDILNRLDKQAVYEPEAVHIGFPVNLPGGTMRLDIPWAIVDPQKDLMSSACRNYLTIQRWADVSGEKAGLTLASFLAGTDGAIFAADVINHNRTVVIGGVSQNPTGIIDFTLAPVPLPPAALPMASLSLIVPLCERTGKRP